MPARRMTVGLLLVFTAVDRILAADSSDFKPFTSKEGEFTISFPGKPETTSNMIRSPPNADIEMHAFEATRNNRKESYTVTYSDVSAEQLKNIAPERFFDSVQQGGIDHLAHGKLVKVPKTAKPDRGLPSRDLEIEIEGTTTFSRLVLAGNRLYVIMAYPDGTSGSAGRAKLFLNSFKLRKDEPGAGTK